MASQEDQPAPVAATVPVLSLPVGDVAPPAGAGDETDLSLSPELPERPPLLVPPPLFSAYQEPPEPFRFSLREMLGLTAFAAVLLGIFRVVDPALFAAIAGIATFLGLVALSMMQPRRAIIHLGWWMMVTIYLIAALAAILREHA